MGGQATLTAGGIAVLMSPALPGGFGGIVPPGAAAGLAAAAIGVSAFFLGPLLYFLAIQRAGIVLPAVLMATIPLFTLLFAAVFLKTIPPWLGLAGIPLAVIGSFVALRGEHEPWRPPDTRPQGSGPT